MKTYIFNLKQKLSNFVKNEKNDFALSFVIGLTIVFTCSILNYSYVYSMNIKQDLRDNVIRFHVLANSNSEEDQNLKVLVKDSILNEYKDNLTSFETRDDAITFFNDNMEEIENYAQKIVIEQGFKYNVKCELAYTDFPTKSYKDITLPKGEYLAFRVLIGNHTGENFWCVLYPPLCYVEATDEKEFNEAKLTLEDSLTDDEFFLISETEKPEIFIKFKIVEMWESL